jgi:hypothetical protein
LVSSIYPDKQGDQKCRKIDSYPKEESGSAQHYVFHLNIYAIHSCESNYISITGVFDSTPLYVKEPNGDYRPEHEWSRQGMNI